MNEVDEVIANVMVDYADKKLAGEGDEGEDEHEDEGADEMDEGDMEEDDEGDDAGEDADATATSFLQEAAPMNGVDEVIANVMVDDADKKLAGEADEGEEDEGADEEAGEDEEGQEGEDEHEDE